MNKKDFATLLREVIRTEMEPIVQSALAKEFRALREALVATSPQTNTRTNTRGILSEDIKIDDLIEDEGLLLKDIIEQDEDEMTPKRKLFKSDNVFTNMLQQTIEEGYKAGTIQKQVSNASAGQNLVQIEDSSGQMPNRSDMINTIGYGDLGEGNAARIPGTKVVQVPQATPDGKPINPNGIPDFLLNAMNKNYSKDLKDLEKADKRRHGQ